MENNLKIIVFLLIGGVFGVDTDEVKIEGDSVTLKTYLNDIQKDHQILWRLIEADASKKLLVQIKQNKAEYKPSVDGGLRGRLHVDTQTGDLTIRNLRMKYSGLYEAEINNPQTSYKRFNVIVKESPRVTDAESSDVKSVSVMEGESVTLHADEQIQKDDLILWRFGDKNVLIAKCDMEDNKISYDDDDGRFSGGLKLDESGNLTITNIRTSNAGVYKLKISSSSRETKYKTFTVSVSGVSGDNVSVMEGESVTLHTKFTDTQRDEILWRFGPEGSSILLVHINGSTLTDKKIERFKDKLQISDIQTGDLIIKNMRKNHAGVYRVEINTAAGTFKKIFNVTVNDAPGVLDVGTDEVKSVLGTEGESVTFNTDVKLQRDALILWRFGYKGALIAKDDVDDNKTPEYPDERFRGRLQVNNQTGALIIKDLTYADSGVYKLKISNNKQIIHKTFSLSVRGGLSAGYKVLIWILAILALAAALGAVLAALRFWYRRSQLKVQEIFVKEGESVTLQTADIKGFIFGDAVIEWKYGDKVIIAEINTNDNTKTTPNERYQSRLNLNNETGDLTINNLKTKHSGLYKLKITSSRGWPFSILGASYCQFNVIVKERIVHVKKRDPVTLLTDVKELQKDDLILWMTGAEDTHIAKFTVGTKDPVFYGYTDDRFNDRLKINPQTGDLTIKDITPERCGLYRVLICSDKRSTYRRFKVSIIVPAVKGKSVDLKTEGEKKIQMQNGHRVEWSFRDDPSKCTSYDKITLVTGVNGDSSKTKYSNKRFKDRLKMDATTGDLNIRDIRQTDEGVYTLKLITDGKIIHWVFSVVFDSTRTNKNEPAAEDHLLNEEAV